MTKLDTLYKIAADSPSDMRPHVPILRDYAAGRSVLELGVRYGVSTSAFLAGYPRRMVSVDMNPFVYQESYEAAAKEAGLDWQFYQSSSLDPREVFDLVFFDTTHYADHVRAELQVHVTPGVRFLIFHDTVLFGEIGDGGNPLTMTNPDPTVNPPGILYAIREFMRANPEWRLVHNSTYDATGFTTHEEHYAMGCGLMILGR